MKPDRFCRLSNRLTLCGGSSSSVTSRRSFSPTAASLLRPVSATTSSSSSSSSSDSSSCCVSVSAEPAVNSIGDGCVPTRVIQPLLPCWLVSGSKEKVYSDLFWQNSIYFCLQQHNNKKTKNIIKLHSPRNQTVDRSDFTKKVHFWTSDFFYHIWSCCNPYLSTFDLKI